MIPLLAYAIIAVLSILLLALLVRKTRLDEPSEAAAEEEYALGLWDGQCLNLSERIFDSADYRWLRDELGFLHLARSLARSRKRLAIRWLKALRGAFEDMVCIPGEVSSGGNAGAHPRSWHLLWLTLRFHLALGYALLVVRLFGPCHRLIPPFDWRPFIPESSSREGRYGMVDLGDLD
jgi:hypothetical protein